jgi:hypothetical protein
VIPFGHGEDEFPGVFSLVGRIGVLDNERTAQAVGILTLVVRMVPVCSWLIGLDGLLALVL